MEILLTHPGKEKIYALIDDEDFDRVSNVKWQLHKPKLTHYTFYAACNKSIKGKLTRRWMHRDVLGLTDAKAKVDHIDGNGLNNQKKNLRIVSMSQNALNAQLRIDNKSGYKGVQKSANGKRWVAGITQNHKSMHLGTFETKEEAALAYNQKAKELCGEYVRLNEIRYLKKNQS